MVGVEGRVREDRQAEVEPLRGAAAATAVTAAAAAAVAAALEASRSAFSIRLRAR